MYNVSEAYIEAIKRPSKTRRLTGYIGTQAFTEDNVQSGSFNVNNQCSEGNAQIGTVYMGELSAVFTGIDLIGQWQGKEIEVSDGLLLEDGTWEDVPLGYYTITEAILREDGVYITAYDDMLKFDKTFTLSTIDGYPYDLLRYICTECEVYMAQTEEEIKALPNGTTGLVLYSENDVSTCRDLLHWIAQTLGCFATINREGKLELRQYGVEPVYTMEQYERWTGAAFSDFVSYYSMASCVNMEISSDSTYYWTSQMHPDYGLTYELGANPLIQGGALSPKVEAILTGLDRIYYTPFQVQRSGCPAFDLGDVIAFRGGIAEGKRGCVMSFDYTFHGEYEIQGYGSNPALMYTKSRTDKELSRAMSRSNVNEIQFYSYTNARALTIEDDWKQIIHLRFGSAKATIVTFHAEIKCDADITDAQLDKLICEVMYVYNQNEVEYKPVETWIEGTHLLHLLYYFPVNGAVLNELSVRMRCDGEIFIDRACIQAALWGQGLVASSDWQGIIELEDYQPEVAIGTAGMAVDAIHETAQVKIYERILLEFRESVGAIALDTTPVPDDITDLGVYINKEPIHGAFKWSDMKEMTWQTAKDEYAW